MRFDRDLDPGKLIVPEISLIGWSTISGTVEGFSGAAATEALTTTCLDEEKPPFVHRKELDFWVNLREGIETGWARDLDRFEPET